MKADLLEASVPANHLRRRKRSAACGKRRPQNCAGGLSGDLDTIVLQAMRKDPLRRYASVEQFAEDIRRHLEGLPVTARRIRGAIARESLPSGTSLGWLQQHSF